MVMNLLLVPFMIKRMGKDEYGTMLLVRTFITYLPMLTLAVGPAISRYVTHAVGRNDLDEANRYMCTGFVAMLATAVVFMLAGSICALFLPRLIALGTAARASQILLVFLAAATATTYFTNIFTTPLYAKEKLAEINVITLTGDIVRTLTIVLTFIFLAPSLIWFGVAWLVGSLVSNQIAVSVAYRGFPWLKLSLRNVDRTALKSLVSFSAFSTIGTLVWALYYGSANFIIKWLYGPAGLAMITIYSVGACWDPWIRSAIAPLIRIIMPRMTLLSSQDRGEDMRRLIVTAIRYATCLVAPVCVFVSVYATPILALWLGKSLPKPDQALAARTIPIFLLPLIVALGTSPSQAIFVAQARIAAPTIAALIGAILNVVLGTSLCRFAGWGLSGLATGTGLTLAAIAVGFIPYYLRKIAGLSFTDFYIGALARPIALAAVFAGVCLAVLNWRSPHNLIELGLSFAVCGMVYAIGAYLIVLRPHDRDSALSTARSIAARIRSRQPA